jgi:cytoskeletal protein RodZ
MRVGSELKAARKKAGLTVEVMSKRTKIQVSKLVALEKNDVKNLPTGLYLFSFVRAYAREVRIDPEPIVERLRAEFADKDALDALQALNATGALGAKNSTDATRSKDEHSNLLRNAAIAAGVLLMAAGAGAGAYLYNGRIAHAVNPPRETPTVLLSAPAPATMVATAVDVPQQAAGAAPHRSLPTKSHRPKRRTAAVTPELQETVASVGEFPSPERIEEPAERPANIEELRPEAPVVATAP